MNEFDKKEKTGKKNNKVLLIVLVILALVVGWIGGFVVSDKLASKTDEVKSNSKKAVSDDKDDDKDEVLTQSEKDEISMKVSQILFSGVLNRDSNYIAKDDETRANFNFLSKILIDGTITDQNKALIALNLAKANKVSADKDELSEEEVKKNYKEYFGSDWKDIDLNSLGYCPTYSYNASKKVFEAVSGACGGSTATSIVLHKEDYEIDDGIATVDVYAASYTDDLNGGAVLTNEFDFIVEKMDQSKIINRGSYVDNYTFTAADLEKTNKYEMSFKKASDGTFYFNSIIRD